MKLFRLFILLFLLLGCKSQTLDNKNSDVEGQTTTKSKSIWKEPKCRPDSPGCEVQLRALMTPGPGKRAAKVEISVGEFIDSLSAISEHPSPSQETGSRLSLYTSDAEVSHCSRIMASRDADEKGNLELTVEVSPEEDARILAAQEDKTKINVRPCPKNQP